MRSIQNSLFLKLVLITEMIVFSINNFFLDFMNNTCTAGMHLVYSKKAFSESIKTEITLHVFDRRIN